MRYKVSDLKKRILQLDMGENRGKYQLYTPNEQFYFCILWYLSSTEKTEEEKRHKEMFVRGFMPTVT